MSDNSSNNKRIAKNTAFLYIRMFFVLVVSLYTSRVILNTLGVADYGVYNVVAGFVSMFGFLNASITACIQRYYNFEQGKNGNIGFQRVYTMSCYIVAIISILVLTTLEIIGVWYINNKLVVQDGRLYAANILFQLSALQMIMVLMQAPFSGAVLAKERMDFYAGVGIIDVVLKLIIVIILPYLGYDSLIVFAILMSLISVVDFVLYFLYSKIRFREMKLTLFWDKELFSSMLSFSGWNVFGAVAMVGRTQGLNMILNLFYGTIVNAARGVAVQVQGALMGFIGNISIAARPQIVESYAKGDTKRSINLMYTISKACFLFLLLMALPVSLNIDYILSIWLGDSVPQYTNEFSILILLSALIDVLNTPVTMLIMATGIVKRYCFYTSLGGLLVLPLAYCVLYMGMPPSSTFVAGIIVSAIVQCISIIELKRITKVSILNYMKNVVIPLLSVLAVCVTPSCILKKYLTDSFCTLIITSTLSIVCVIFFSYVIGLTSQEKKIVTDMLIKIVKKIRK